MKIKLQNLTMIQRTVLIVLAMSAILGTYAVIVRQIRTAAAVKTNYQYEVYDDHVELVEYLARDIENVRVPDKMHGKPVTVIKEGCFARHKEIETVYLGKNIKEIEKSSFAGCGSLKKVSGKAELEVIPEDAFSGCNYLHTVDVGNHIKRIENYAFYWCPMLKFIGEQPELEYIGQQAFNFAGYMTDFQIPEYVELGWAAFWGSLWPGIQGEEFVIVGDCLVAYFGDARAVEIPQGVKRLGAYAFEDCKTVEDIEEIRLPETVTEVETNAFYDCGKIRVYMPDSVTIIDANYKDSRIYKEGDENTSMLSFHALENITIVTTKGSYAEEYAKAKGLQCEIVKPWWE